MALDFTNVTLGEIDEAIKGLVAEKQLLGLQTDLDNKNTSLRIMEINDQLSSLRAEKMKRHMSIMGFGS